MSVLGNLSRETLVMPEPSPEAAQYLAEVRNNNKPAARRGRLPTGADRAGNYTMLLALERFGDLREELQEDVQAEYPDLLAYEAPHWSHYKQLTAGDGKQVGKFSPAHTLTYATHTLGAVAHMSGDTLEFNEVLGDELLNSALLQLIHEAVGFKRLAERVTRRPKPPIRNIGLSSPEECFDDIKNHDGFGVGIRSGTHDVGIYLHLHKDVGR